MKEIGFSRRVLLKMVLVGSGLTVFPVKLGGLADVVQNPSSEVEEDIGITSEVGGMEKIYEDVVLKHGLRGARVDYRGDGMILCLRWCPEDLINRQLEAVVQGSEARFDIGVSAWMDAQVAGKFSREWQYAKISSGIEFGDFGRLMDSCDKAYVKVSGWGVVDLTRKFIFEPEYPVSKLTGMNGSERTFR